MASCEIKKKFPFEISELDPSIAKQLPALKNEDLVFVGPKRYCYGRFFIKTLREFYNFKIRQDDVWVFGFPRSGTTLTQEILWLLGNNLDYERAAKEVLEVRFPVFDTAGFFENEFKEIVNQRRNFSKETVEIVEQLAKPVWENFAETKERRFIKTHIPLSLAPPDLLETGCKIVYLARNPKDLFISGYSILHPDEAMNEEDFTNMFYLFSHGLLKNTPYLEHVKEGWQLREHKNILFLFYEEYRKDLRKTVKKIANFLGRSLSDDELNKLEDHLKIENFKKNKSVNNEHLRDVGIMKGRENLFIRKGKVGEWSDYFKGELNAETDRWIEESLKGTGLKFP